MSRDSLLSDCLPSTAAARREQYARSAGAALATSPATGSAPTAFERPRQRPRSMHTGGLQLKGLEGNSLYRKRLQPRQKTV